MSKSEDMILQALSKFESKIDKLDERLDSIEKVQIKQEANIEHHVKRTDLAEENTAILREEMAKNIEAIQTDMKPVQAHVAYMNGALKLIGVVGTFVAIAAGIVKVLEFFH